jgi:hypothetical protein
MNSNEIQNDKIQSTLIKVEALQKEYDVTLQQYQEAGNNYITSLQTDNTNSTVFTALKGRTWWGTKGLSEGTASTQEECENMCANSDQCTGATFNPVKRYCWTRTGESSLTVGRDDDYALITQQKSAITVMKQLNQKLLDINQKINNELQNINPQVVQQYEEKNKKQQQLSVSYNQLLEQKIEIDKQLQEYYSIQQEEENQNLYVTQQNVSFRFWVLITCLVVLFTIKRIIGSESAPISIIIWLLIIIVLIILTYSLSRPSGFLIWFIVLVAIFLMKTGNLPSP